jgi:class 3 adenylate cyclase
MGGITPERVAEMGMEMIAGVEGLRTSSGEGVRIRVGMHVGPAIAGVIAIRKFIYDVWGDTVNTASRMESHGVPARIQVTQATYERLRGSFDFEPRGPVDVTGKGWIPVWLLVGPRVPRAQKLVGGSTTVGT